MKSRRRTGARIELLSPARNAEIGREAILAGADAVYIGAHSFGARSAAANSAQNETAKIQVGQTQRRGTESSVVLPGSATVFSPSLFKYTGMQEGLYTAVCPAEYSRRINA